MKSIDVGYNRIGGKIITSEKSFLLVKKDILHKF